MRARVQGGLKCDVFVQCCSWGEVTVSTTLALGGWGGREEREREGKEGGRKERGRKGRGERGRKRREGTKEGAVMNEEMERRGKGGRGRRKREKGYKCYTHVSAL